ncbi:TetR/AcrR family transcriptional regulator [Streptacidiphilus fuscans]|uniref:TetR/AcrR family transcriptional regulator n=1 Tax=Streptacidiphilus fuscans TaxID=2789292 RepID=A0A931B7L3_9ACTN|nr:TetR/AcrR family transcriptional regulator [Streptacidiphilus fuscans]MBF9070137.1 TetR/AcrR family transcriptional regulator [Streptacidiphilus fuscans]
MVARVEKDVEPDGQTDEAQQAAKRRVALTRESILEAALRLCSPEGGGQLTFSRLGKELGADPTAVYRHFRDKDELVLALTDLTIQEGIDLARAALPDGPSDDWRAWLTVTSESVRASYLARPALAVLAAARTTASPAETHSVELLISVLHRAGLGVVEAAECYRSLLDLTLAMTQYTAAFSSLDPATQAKDEAAWAVKYATLPEEEFPLLHRSAPRLTELFRDDAEVFRMTLATFLDGVAARIERARQQRGASA